MVSSVASRFKVEILKHCNVSSTSVQLCTFYHIKFLHYIVAANTKHPRMDRYKTFLPMKSYKIHKCWIWLQPLWYVDQQVMLISHTTQSSCKVKARENTVPVIKANILIVDTRFTGLFLSAPPTSMSQCHHTKTHIKENDYNWVVAH